MKASFRWALMLTGAAFVAACSSGPAEVSRAREVLAERTAENPAHYQHAVTIMAGSDAPHALAMTREAIAGPNRTAAAEAIRGLGPSVDGETVAALRAAFDTGGSVKALAAAKLASFDDAEAIAWLADQLGQGGTVLPAEAMAALAVTEHAESVRNALRGLIWNKNLSIRNEGYVILGQVHAPWAVDLLLEGLDKEFGEERVQPIQALGRLGDPAAAKAVRNWVDTQGLVLASLEALGRIGDGESLEVIVPMLEHDQPLVRPYAAVAAWELGAKDAVMAAIPALIADENPAVRQALAEQLSRGGGGEVRAWLSQLAEDGDKRVRAEAYRGLLARRSPEELAAVFAAGAQDPDYEVATIALSGLAETGDASHTAALAPLLESDNPYLAISAAHAVLALAGSQP